MSSSHCHTENQTKPIPERKAKRAEPGKLTAPHDTEKGFSPKYTNALGDESREDHKTNRKTGRGHRRFTEQEIHMVQNTCKPDSQRRLRSQCSRMQVSAAASWEDGGSLAKHSGVGGRGWPAAHAVVLSQWMCPPAC